MPEHSFTILNFLIKLIKFFAHWIFSEKFKWSPSLPMQRSLMFLLSTTSILSCKRWCVNCLTVKFALALSYHVVAVEKMVRHWGQFSLIKVFTLREKYPNTEFILVRIFPHSDWIPRNNSYLSVLSRNAGKYGPEKTPYLDTYHVSVIFSSLSKISFEVQDSALSGVRNGGLASILGVQSPIFY